MTVFVTPAIYKGQWPVSLTARTDKGKKGRVKIRLCSWTTGKRLTSRYKSGFGNQHYI